jgi:hypothetical protein
MSLKAYEAMINKYYNYSSDPFYLQYEQLRAQVAASIPLVRENATDLIPALESLSQALKEYPENNCLVCRADLCQYLDAYYGKNPEGNRHCSKCRRQKRIE